MSQAFGTEPVAAEAINADKLRDEISRLSQRLARARASYDQDLFHGEAGVPLEMQLQVIESYVAKLDALTARLRQHESGTLPVAVPAPPSPVVEPAPAAAVREPELPTPTLPTPAPALAVPEPVLPTPASPEELSWLAAAEQPSAVSAPAPPPLPHRAPATASSPQPASAPEPAPTAFQPVLQPVLDPPQAPAAAPFDQGVAPASPAPVAEVAIAWNDDPAVGEYVRLAAEARWLERQRPSVAADLAATCDTLLRGLATQRGVTLEDARQSLVRQVDQRFRRDYG